MLLQSTPFQRQLPKLCKPLILGQFRGFLGRDNFALLVFRYKERQLIEKNKRNNYGIARLPRRFELI